ncbi:MAG TPA: RNA methyltransferase, partial [Methylomirabilota bacterium]|nr:RNA methyltransferase [Methylomirabilota bacterium]
MSDRDRRPEIAAPGAVKQITSLTNPLVKDIRALALKKHRDETGLFLGEGLKLVTDALEDGWPVDTVCFA